MGRSALVGWGVVAVVLVVLGIPWFLWGTDAVVYGLPIWLWWHVGWMVLASLVFWLFATRAWGIGIDAERGPDAEGEAVESHAAGSGDRP